MTIDILEYAYDVLDISVEPEQGYRARKINWAHALLSEGVQLWQCFFFFFFFFFFDEEREDPIITIVSDIFMM